jgi:hypothetical protein
MQSRILSHLRLKENYRNKVFLKKSWGQLALSVYEALRRASTLFGLVFWARSSKQCWMREALLCQQARLLRRWGMET